MADIFDGPWRLYEYDPATGRSVWVAYEDGVQYFRTSYPTENIIRRNAEQAAHVAGSAIGDMAQYGRVPANIYYDQLDQAVQQGDVAYVERWMSNGDNAAWRTRGGNF